MEEGRRIRYQQVDAFTEVPFKGNPAAVCVMDEPMEATQMQAVALEMNLSETAFIYPPDTQGDRRIRWFTPAMEVPLCGHATLASGHVLLSSGSPSPIRLHSASGPLVVHGEPDGAIRLDFPADPVTPTAPPEGLLDALGLAADEVMVGAQSMIVRVRERSDVEEATPNFTDLVAIDIGAGVLVLAVTAEAGTDDLDFVSRVFAPWAGIDEDPVTGLAHTALIPYWTGRLDTDTLRAAQISARGGRLTGRLDGRRVHLIGHAVTVAEGTIRLPSE